MPGKDKAGGPGEQLPGDEQEENQLKETDTKPLKNAKRKMPIHISKDEDTHPPATVLRDASGGRKLLFQDLYEESLETGRVRLVPRPPDPPPWRVIFQTLGKSPSTIGVDVRQGLIVGRRDPDAEDNPDLDLSPHLAREHGVSRQHAMLLPSNEGMYLVDMGSKNGTWVNGVYLDPGVRYPLHSNDRVEFGLLRLTVRSVSLLGKGARD